MVAPSRGRGLKLNRANMDLAQATVAPSRGRGLKRLMLIFRRL